MVAKTFTNAAGGNWNVAANWSPSGVPGSTDDAFINNPGSYTVTLSDSESPGSITLDDANATLDLNSLGTIQDTTIFLDAGTLLMDGLIVGGTIDAGGAVFDPSSGTLDGVTWVGSLSGIDPDFGLSVMGIADGISLEGAGGVGPGTLDMGSLFMVDIIGATTLDNADIVFQAVTNEYLDGSFSLPLYFGPDLVVTQTIAGSSGEISGADLISRGTLDAASSHGRLFIGANTFDNLGTIIVTGGDSFVAQSSFTNNGVVTVNASSLLTTGPDGIPTNDTTIAISTAGTLIADTDIGGTGAITLASHAVAELYDLGGTVVFEDNEGTLDLLAPATFTGGLSGFRAGDTIDLPGQAVTTHGYSGTAGGGTLTLQNGATVVAALDFVGDYRSAKFATPSDGGTGVDVIIACYVEGTHILTVFGEVPVEALRIGDRLPACLGGRLARVRWTGHRRIDCRRHPRPAGVWPVRVCAGAFGAATPHRDLWLSPDHAVFVDDGLIPIRYLVNGASIAQVETAEVTYWHVELDRHEILLAEGVAAESFLDTGNRGAFENAGAIVRAHPAFALRVWEEKSCAPLVLSGPTLAAARERLLARAQVLGFALTTEPEPRLIVDGQTVCPDLDGATYRFVLPDGAREVRLVSRAVVPGQVLADSTDHRRVGVAVSGLRVDGAVVPAGDPRRAGGWHAADAHWQWTDGDAGLAIAGARQVEVTLLALLPYWDGDAAGARLAAR